MGEIEGSLVNRVRVTNLVVVDNGDTAEKVSQVDFLSNPRRCV